MQNQIQALRQQGLSSSGIPRAIGLHRKIVCQYLLDADLNKTAAAPQCLSTCSADSISIHTSSIKMRRLNPQKMDHSKKIFEYGTFNAAPRRELKNNLRKSLNRNLIVLTFPIGELSPADHFLYGLLVRQLSRDG